MKFSIVLPVRNGGQLVKDCVDAILAQTVTDFSLHILDNCSTDGTLEWINSLKDDRIKIYSSDKSLTIEENWARIITIPKNEFLTLIGHDDILDLQYLQIMDDLISKHPDAGLYQTHFTYIDHNSKIIRQCKPMQEMETAPEFLASFLTGKIDMMGTGFMMRSKDYDMLGGIPLYPSLIFADAEIFIRLAKKNYKVTSRQNGFYYRLHQSTTKLSSDATIQKALGCFVYFLSSLAKEDEKFAKIIRQHGIHFLLKQCKAISHRMLRTPIENRDNLSVRNFIDQCRQYAKLLVPSKHFDPSSMPSIRFAEMLDQSSIGRNLFLAFKKIYPKSVMK